LLLFDPAGAQPKTDREKEHLIGSVKSVRSEVTDYDRDSSPRKGRARQLDTVTYDVNGNEVERIIYDDYGFLVGKEIRTYDANDVLIETRLSDPKGPMMERRVYGVDNGKLAQIITYGPKNVAVLKQIDAYDANGRLQQELYFDPDKLRGKTVYKYDQSSNISEVNFYLADGSKAIAPIGPCLGAHRVIYTYDKERRLDTAIAFEPDGKMKQSWRYAYSSKGQVAEDTRESDWSITKFVNAYEYDSHGNWVKQVSNVTFTDRSNLMGGGPTSRRTETLREIIYY
jgi:hypothetical protein